jgi:hypothetical protein
MKHKLKQAMLERDARKRLAGRIEIDDAYLGGERAGGKRGRGAPGKTPFVVARPKIPDGVSGAEPSALLLRGGAHWDVRLEETPYPVDRALL